MSSILATQPIVKSWKEKFIDIMGAHKGETRSMLLGDMMFSNIIYSAFPRPPDVVLGIYPFYKCQVIEFTTSQDILKYRAVGAQFLAKQKGAYWAMRVDIVFTPEEAALALCWLDVIFLYGGDYEKHEDAVDNISPDSYYSGNKYKVNPVAGEKNLNLIPTDNHVDEKDNVEDVGDVDYADINNWDFMKNTWHRTFPIVTKDQVYSNCFVESFIYNQDVGNGGGKEVSATILLRQFTPPPELIKVEVINREMTNRFKAANYSDKELQELVEVPGELTKTILTVNATLPNKSKYTTSIYNMENTIVYVKGTQVPKTTKNTTWEAHDINGNEIIAQVPFSPPKNDYLSYGYAEAVATSKNQHRILSKSRMPQDMDSIVLVYNALRRAKNIAYDWLTTPDFISSMLDPGSIGSNLLSNGRRAVFDSEANNLFSKIGSSNHASKVGSNKTIDINREDLLQYTKYSWDSVGYIDAVKFGIIFNKQSTESTKFSGTKNKVTHVFTVNAPYIWDGVLFIGKDNKLLMWKYIP